MATPPRYQPHIVAHVPTGSPEQIPAALAKAVNERDLDAALALWADDAVIVQPDGSQTRGRDAVALTMQALIDSGVTLDIRLAAVFATGDVATASGTLTLNGTGADGEPFAQRSSSVVVYSRGADGWRIALDAPWGLPTA